MIDQFMELYQRCNLLHQIQIKKKPSESLEPVERLGDKQPVRRRVLVLELDQVLLSFHNEQIVIRPYAQRLIQEMSISWQIVIFTHWTQNVADTAIKQLVVQDLIDQKFYKSSCLLKQGIYIKDLSKLKTEPQIIVLLDRVLCPLYPKNTLVVSGWRHPFVETDNDLLKTIKMLKTLEWLPDVRMGIK